MGKPIDKLKKERYKQERLKGNSIAQSLRNSGYAESTARKSSWQPVSKQGEAELMQQVKASDITVEWVVNQLTRELVASDAKASDRIRVSELLGKYINMFKDSNPIAIINIEDTIDKLRVDKPIDVSSSNCNV